MGAVPIAKALEFNNTLTVLALRVRGRPKKEELSLKILTFQNPILLQQDWRRSSLCTLADSIKLNHQPR